MLISSPSPIVYVTYLTLTNAFQKPTTGLTHPLISPQLQTLPPQLHRPARHPQEDQPLILQLRYSQLPHLIV